MPGGVLFSLFWLGLFWDRWIRFRRIDRGPIVVHVNDRPAFGDGFVPSCVKFGGPTRQSLAHLGQRVESIGVQIEKLLLDFIFHIAARQ